MGEKGNHAVQDTVIVNGDVYMSSRVIAWELHRAHKDILEKVRRYTTDSLDSYYIDKQGKRRTSYLVSRDGFILMNVSAK